MGESDEGPRWLVLHQLATLEPHPESVPSTEGFVQEEPVAEQGGSRSLVW